MENEKKTAEKQAETVTISRAEYEEPKLQDQRLLEQLVLAKKRQSGSVTEIVPEGTPTEVVEHRLSDEELVCSACGSQMVEIGKDVRRTLQMKPAQFRIREDVYYTCACKNCELETGEANILKTPKEPALLPGSSAGRKSFMAMRRCCMY